MAADVHACRLKSSDILLREVLVASKAARDDEEGGGHPVSPKDGQNVRDRVAVAVIDRDEDWLRRKGASLEQRVVDLTIRDRVEAASLDSGDRAFEDVGLHGQVGNRLHP